MYQIHTVVLRAVCALSTCMMLVPDGATQEYMYNDHIELLRDGGEKVDILPLGTFHFKDAGLDSYKPQHDIDVLSPQRQDEIDDILSRLERFAPTKIALEVKWDQQQVLDSLYDAYLNGEFELKSSEKYQLGFKLAKRLGHERVYAVDAERRSFYEDYSREDFAALSDSMHLYGLEDSVWNQRFFDLYAYDDSLKTTMSIREFLVYGNSPERVMAGHGHYVIGNIRYGKEDRFPGADLTAGWFVRNQRIFHNIMRITESADDRILLIFGAGHMPYLRLAIDASPVYRLVEPGEYLFD